MQTYQTNALGKSKGSVYKTYFPRALSDLTVNKCFKTRYYYKVFTHLTLKSSV